MTMVKGSIRAMLVVRSSPQGQVLGMVASETKARDLRERPRHSVCDDCLVVETKICSSDVGTGRQQVQQIQ